MLALRATIKWMQDHSYAGQLIRFQEDWVLIHKRNVFAYSLFPRYWQGAEFMAATDHSIGEPLYI